MSNNAIALVAISVIAAAAVACRINYNKTKLDEKYHLVCDELLFEDIVDVETEFGIAWVKPFAGKLVRTTRKHGREELIVTGEVKCVNTTMFIKLTESTPYELTYDEVNHIVKLCGVTPNQYVLNRTGVAWAAHFA